MLILVELHFYDGEAFTLIANNIQMIKDVINNGTRIILNDSTGIWVNESRKEIENLINQKIKEMKGIN